MSTAAAVPPDGLATRPSGRWALAKLYYLQRYIYAFNQVTKGKKRRAFVDLMAGPGRCHLQDQPTYHFEGSPMLAANSIPAFESMLFAEGDPKLAAALRERLTTKGQSPDLVIQADCNSVEVIDRARAVLDDSLGLVFADTLGLSTLQFSTLQHLVKNRRFDLIYTFHVQDVTRNIGQTAESASETARFTASLGSSDWRDAWVQYRQTHPATSDADAIEEFFDRRLKSLGYGYVAPLRDVMKNTKGAPLYRLWLASHYSGAPKLWDGISDIDHRGQHRLW